MLNALRNVAVVAVFGSAMLAATATRGETAGQYLDDATLATRTKAALVNDKTVSALDINVEVYKGSVQLSGFVASAAEEVAALATAGKVEGAGEVLDAIVVMPGSRSMGEAVDDTTIQAKLKAALAKVEGIGNAIAVNTEVRQGQVLLAGFVTDARVKSAAAAAARGIEGVKEVHDFIAVRR